MTTLSCRSFALGVLLTLSPGCYTTVIQSGRPVSPATVAWKDHWHHGLFWGIAEVSGPYDLSRICPNGWAEIKTETSFLNGLLRLISQSIYSPQTVTVRCSAAPQPAAAHQPLPSTAEPTPTPPSPASAGPQSPNQVTPPPPPPANSPQPAAPNTSAPPPAASSEGAPAPASAPTPPAQTFPNAPAPPPAKPTTPQNTVPSSQ